MIINGVYELPFFYSGGPLGITSSTSNTFAQASGQRPNWTDVNASSRIPVPIAGSMFPIQPDPRVPLREHSTDVQFRRSLVA